MNDSKLNIEDLSKLKITKVRDWSINFTYDGVRYYIIEREGIVIRSNDSKEFGISGSSSFWVSDFLKTKGNRKCLCDYSKEYFVKQLMLINIKGFSCLYDEYREDYENELKEFRRKINQIEDERRDYIKQFMFGDREVEQMDKKLVEISKLPNNWNDNGAFAFSDDLIKKVDDILEQLPIKPFISPTAWDSIQLEYEKESGEYLEFEISETEIECFELVDKGKEKYETVSIEKMKDKVLEFWNREVK